MGRCRPLPQDGVKRTGGPGGRAGAAGGTSGRLCAVPVGGQKVWRATVRTQVIMTRGGALLLAL